MEDFGQYAHYDGQRAVDQTQHRDVTVLHLAMTTLDVLMMMALGM